MDVLRFGFAGLGVASTQILPFLSRHPRAKITAAADTRQDALDKFASAYGAETFLSVEEMCKSPNVDAIYICTPNHLHKEHVILAARHGKHMIVEKPMALTIEECEAMNEAVEKHGVKLLCGHTKSFDVPILKMRDIVQSGELGRLMMINTWNFTDFIYRPRMPQELDTKRGGGVVYVQGPHQVDIVRIIGGRKLRSVRAMTGIFDDTRPTEGFYSAYLEFEDGTPVSMVYNGYSHFDTAEFHYWIGEGGLPRNKRTNSSARNVLLSGKGNEESLKEAMRFGGSKQGEWLAQTEKGQGEEKGHPFFGVTLASCEKGDIRQSPEGLYIYGDEGRIEVPLPKGGSRHISEIDELIDAVVNDRTPFHDGRWGEATLEVCLAIYESARGRKEILLQHQT